MARTRVENARDLLHRQHWLHRHQGKTFKTGLRRAIDHVLCDAPEGQARSLSPHLQRLFDNGYSAGLVAARDYLDRLERTKTAVRAAGGRIPADDAADDEWWEAHILTLPLFQKSGA